MEEHIEIHITYKNCHVKLQVTPDWLETVPTDVIGKTVELLYSDLKREIDKKELNFL